MLLKMGRAAVHVKVVHHKTLQPEHLTHPDSCPNNLRQQRDNILRIAGHMKVSITPETAKQLIAKYAA